MARSDRRFASRDKYIVTPSQEKKAGSSLLKLVRDSASKTLSFPKSAETKWVDVGNDPQAFKMHRIFSDCVAG